MADHRWTFERVGGFDQPRITTGADLAAIAELDQKLWVALACPVAGLEMDERTLALIDSDHDGRVRAAELIAAIKWATGLLKDDEVLAKGADGLALDEIDDSTDEGKLVLRTAKELLERAGHAGSKTLAIADVKVAIEAFEKQAFNGDSILPADSASDETVKKAIEDVLACTKPETDKGGKPGVTKATVEAFFKDIAAHAAWLKKGEEDTTIATLGADTAAAFAAVAAVRAKVDDYFTRQRIVAYDKRALVAMNGEEKDYLALTAKQLSLGSAEVASLPLAQIDGTRSVPLPLEQGVNPAWAAKLADLRAKAVKPILGDRAALSEADWATLTAKLVEHEKWLGAKEGASVEKLGAARVKELAASDLQEKILALVAEDAAKEPLAKAIENVEKLVRLRRDLMTLANNFVAFRDFYDRRRDKAIFQAGTL